MVKFISRNIITGLITILPIILTIYLLYWLVVSLEMMLSSATQLLLPEQLYRPGMSFIVIIVIAFIIGLLMHTYVARWLFSKGEQLLFHMPLIKSIYRAMRDLFDYFSPTKKKEFKQVVSVTVGDTGMQLIGFVTQSNSQHLPKGLQLQDHILVYLPLSYMIGGYAVLMPSSAVRPLDISMEDAMRLTLTAGITGSIHGNDKNIVSTA